ncbi:MAG: hypothetical protein KAJ75_09360, partial [Alphaproteobacteria bacterium]|nr:hypothetical protein [Alphaproteobacteria bacterium]
MTRILVFVFCVLVSGCSAFKKEPPPPCPYIAIDRNTADLTVFEGTGRDITDKKLDVKIQSFTGNCIYGNEKNNVEVTLSLKFGAELGTAAKERKGCFSYFAAIPQFFPKKEGKQLFNVEVEFPPNINHVEYRDEELVINIPLKDGETG